MYRGHRSSGSGPGVVTITATGGAVLGVLGHVVLHSPEGMNWGYVGSGPADCARSLLLAALGTKAICSCTPVAKSPSMDETMLAIHHARQLIEHRYERIDSHKASQDDLEPLVVVDEDTDFRPVVGTDPQASRRPCTACRDGLVHVPYEAFLGEVVAHLPMNWSLTRAQILDWLAAQCAPGIEETTSHAGSA